MSKKQLYFLAGAIFIFIFINWLVPIYIIHDNGLLLGAVAAAAAAICTYKALKPDTKTMYTPENYESGKSRMTLAIVGCVIAAVATILTMIFTSGPREDAYIKKHSVVAEGLIVDGRSETTKRRGSTSTTYKLDVRFTVNGKGYEESVNVEGSDWNNAGKGMPVLVSYAKDHPGMCKILFNADQVKKYTNSDRIKPLNLDVLTQVFDKESNELIAGLKKFSMGWSIQSEDETVYYYNSVFKTTLVKSELIYLIETGRSDNFNSLLADARKNMEVVYDSLTSNPKEGVLFKKDSLQIRFQQYREAKTEDNNEYGFPMMTYTTNYVVGLSNKMGPILLPGDLAPDLDDPATMNELRRKAAKESLERMRNQ